MESAGRLNVGTGAARDRGIGASTASSNQAARKSADRTARAGTASRSAAKARWAALSSAGATTGAAQSKRETAGSANARGAGAAVADSGGGFVGVRSRKAAGSRTGSCRVKESDNNSRLSPSPEMAGTGTSSRRNIRAMGETSRVNAPTAGAAAGSPARASVETANNAAARTGKAAAKGRERGLFMERAKRDAAKRKLWAQQRTTPA